MPVPEAKPWFSEAPDWLREVASPSTERIDHGIKLWRYHRAGVGQVWLVEPLARRIEVLAPDPGARPAGRGFHRGRQRLSSSAGRTYARLARSPERQT